MKDPDVIIIGSGLVGSTLALILARHGHRVVLVERGRHPRFAIGEAGIKETSLSFLALARCFDVPELLALTSAKRLNAATGATSGQKQSFSFLWHGPGEPHRPEHTVQVGSPPFPFGADPHYHRAAVDHYLARAAVARGARLIEGAEASAFEVSDDGVEVALSRGEQLRGRFVVDCAGGSAPVGRALGLFDDAPPMTTRSWAIFTHMSGVRPCDDAVTSARACGLPQTLHGGTVHHIFDGGWMWIIPFGNAPHSRSPVCSVGLCLDGNKTPPDGRTAQAWVDEILGRYPSMAQQLEGAAPLRPWSSTGRLQYRARSLVAGRAVLSPHGAGFVDPLFSRGLYISAAGVGLLARALMTGVAGDDAQPDLSAYEAFVTGSIAAQDRLVAAAYQAFASFELFNAWHRVWALGVFYESLRLGGAHLRLADDDPGLLPGPGQVAFPLDIPPYAALFDSAEAVVDACGEGLIPPKDAAAQIFGALKSSQAVPSPLRYDTPSRRYLDANGPAAQLRLRRWARRGRPPDGITQLFDYPLWGAARLWLQRLHAGGKMTVGEASN